MSGEQLPVGYIENVEHDQASGAKKVKIVDGTLNASDIEIGAVEIKDGGTDQRAVVDASGRLQVLDQDVKGVLDTVAENTEFFRDIDYTFNRNADGSMASIVATDGVRTKTITFDRDADGNLAGLTVTIS